MLAACYAGSARERVGFAHAVCGTLSGWAPSRRLCRCPGHCAALLDLLLKCLQFNIALYVDQTGGGFVAVCYAARETDRCEEGLNPWHAHALLYWVMQ